jgi:hypothetical protein
MGLIWKSVGAQHAAPLRPYAPARLRSAMTFLELLAAAAVTGIVAAELRCCTLKRHLWFVMMVFVVAIRTVHMFVLMSSVGCDGLGLWHGAVWWNVSIGR